MQRFYFVCLILTICFNSVSPAVPFAHNRSRRQTSFNANNYGWLELAYSKDDLIDGIPAGLRDEGGYAGVTHNFQVNAQIKEALSTTDASFRSSLETGNFENIAASSLQNIKSAILTVLSPNYVVNIPDDSLVQLLNNNEMQLQGVANLLKYVSVSNDWQIATQIAYTTYPFTESSALCAVLLSFLGTDSSANQNYVPYRLLTQISLQSVDVIDEYAGGATQMMLRSYEQSSGNEQFVQILYQLISRPIDWSKRMARCKVIMQGTFSNLGASLGQWADNEKYDDLLMKTAPLFVCLEPKHLADLDSPSLIETLPFYNNERFDWQHGTLLINQIFNGKMASPILYTSLIADLKGLTKFITLEVIETRLTRQSNFMNDVILTQTALTAITKYNDNPLLLEYLLAKANDFGTRFVMPSINADISTLDIQRVAPFVGVFSLADVQAYSDGQIKESITYFQQKSFTPGIAVLLVHKYLKFSSVANRKIFLTQTDFEQMNRFLPVLDYRFFLNCTLTSLIEAQGVFKNLASRAETRNFPLTAAQQHVIADRSQEDSGRNAKLMTQLGPALSMALSPAFFLEQITDLDEFFMTRVDNGEVSEGFEFLKMEWTPFQKSVLFNMYRQKVRLLPLTGRMLNGLFKLSTGISADDILNVQFTEIIGVTQSVMKHGGDMNKAWLFSLQIRKAFASLYGLKNLKDFHLGLLGTANLQALDGLTLRMFSVREMERLNLGDCNEVIARIGDNRDLYLLPPAKRRELVCFYVARCRLALRNTGNFYPVYDENNHMEQFFNDRFDDDYDGSNYRRIQQNYCNLISQRLMEAARLEQPDFDTLGNLVCDMNSVMIRTTEKQMLRDNLWMFRHCLFDSNVGNALYQQIRDQLDEGAVIKALGHSLCSVVPSNQFMTGFGSGGGVIDLDDERTALMQYVHFAYTEYYKMEDTYGLTKRHLNYGLFAFREISRSQQSKIQNCYRNVAEQAWQSYLQYENQFKFNPLFNIDNRVDLVSWGNVGTNIFRNNQNNNNNNNNDYYNSYNANNNADNAYDDDFDNSVEDEVINTYDTSRVRREEPRVRRQLSRLNREAEIRCSAVHMLHSGSLIFLMNQLETNMKQAMFSRCVNYWGNNFNLTREIKRNLKDRVESLFGGFQNILPEYLIQMKWLALEMTNAELSVLNLKNKQVMYHISYWPWKRWQRQTIYRNIKKTYNLNVNTMGVVDFKALGEFFCGMESSEIASIPPEKYYSMATFVGELVTCDYNQMRSLLAKARSTQAFGEIDNWEERQVIAIGSAIAGMSSTHLEMLTPQGNRGRRNLVAAIPAHAIPMIPESVIENLDVTFFEAMTPEQVIAIIPRQWHDMRDAQASAAMEVWFGYDNWPYSYLKGFREAGANVAKLSVLVLGTLLVVRELL